MFVYFPNLYIHVCTYIYIYILDLPLHESEIVPGKFTKGDQEAQITSLCALTTYLDLGSLLCLPCYPT